MRTFQDLQRHTNSQRSLRPLSSLSPPSTARSTGLTSPSHLTRLANLRIALTRSPKEELVLPDLISHRATATSVSPSFVPMSPLGKKLPLEADYASILSRLDKVIHGSASLRCVMLTEEKPLQFALETWEWQYVRVKTEGMKAPMKVTIQRFKGKVTTYLSKSSVEPTPDSFDFVYHRDTFEFSDSSTRFNAKLVTLGFHCVQDAKITVSVHFGVVSTEHRPIAKSNTLASLSEFRNDEAKRQALFDTVEALLTHREAERMNKFTARNYIRRNILALAAKPDSTDKHEAKDRRRRHAIKRRKELLEEKKFKAELYLRKNELRMEEEARQKAEQEERQRHISMQTEWLRLIAVINSAESLRAVFLLKKQKQREVFRQMRAAILLQHFSRRSVLRVDPKARAQEHALRHLSLCYRLLGPVAVAAYRRRIYSVIRESAEVNKPILLVSKYYAQSKFQAVKLIQYMWRRYRYVKEARMITLSRLWDTALKEIAKESTKNPHKKSKKPVLVLESKYSTINRVPVLEAHLRECKEQFYKRIAAYIKSGKTYRRGVKAMIFLRSNRRDSLFLTGAPSFQYMVTIDDMKEMIKNAGKTLGVARKPTVTPGNT